MNNDKIADIMGNPRRLSEARHPVNNDEIADIMGNPRHHSGAKPSVNDDEIAGLLGNPRYRSGAQHPDEGTIDPKEVLSREKGSSRERGSVDAITEAVRAGIAGLLGSERRLEADGTLTPPGSPAPAQGVSGGTSFAAATPVGPTYDDGQAIQEGDIVADVNECLAEVRSITESGVIINVPAVGLREVTSMKGCTLKGRKKR